jgi:thymidylate synthase (FAD)
MAANETLDTVAKVSASACIELLEIMGRDATVVNAARVSFSVSVPEQEPLRSQDERLLNYLAEHQHESPFFHPTIRLRLRMPIFVAREWFRHTVGFARNEVSRRYVTKPVECFLPDSVREKDERKKQGSKLTPIEHNEVALQRMREGMEAAIRCYRELLQLGAAPEQARIVLPQAMMTEFIETASLAGYARLFGLRNHPDAQYETRQYALEVGKILAQHFPVAWKVLTTRKRAREEVSS